MPDVPALTFHGLKLACPFSDKFRRHTAAELATMEASIVAHGIDDPIRLYHDMTLDRDDCIGDGEGRLTLAIKLGLSFDEVKFEHYGKLTTAEAFERIACLHNDSRRQDSADAIERRQIEIAEKHARDHRLRMGRENGESIRTLAEKEGISKSQVERILAEVGVPHGTPETVKGKDGKEYPASKPKTFATDYCNPPNGQYPASGADYSNPPPATYHPVEAPARPEPTPIPKTAKRIVFDWEPMERLLAGLREELNSAMATLKMPGSYEHTNGSALLDDFESLILSDSKKLLSVKWRHDHAAG